MIRVRAAAASSTKSAAERTDKPMIRNIVFDLGNVIVKYDPDMVVHSLIRDPEDAEFLKNRVFGTQPWLDLDRGIISIPEAMKRMNRDIPSRLHPECALLLMDWYKYFLPVESVCEYILGLKAKGYRLYLLSNLAERYNDYREQIPILKSFDGLMFSFEEHLLKPEPEIFERLFSKFGLLPEESFFIDDTEANIEAGKKMGMNGYVMKSFDTSGLSL